MELHAIDQKVENKNLFMDVHTKDIFNELYKLDLAVDGSKDASTTSCKEVNEFVDPITELMLREVGLVSSPSTKEKCWDVKDILDLLATDKLVEGCTKNNDDNVLEHLHKVDDYVDQKTRIAEEKKEMDDVRDLYNLDQEVERNAKTFEVGKQPTTSAEKPKSEMDAIMDLYETDLQVEDAKYNAFFKTKDAAVYQELYKTDSQVDKIDPSTDQSLTDPFTKSTLNQYAQEAKSIASRHESNVGEVMDLYSTDLQIGAAASRRDIKAEEAVASLYEVDEEIEKLKGQKSSTNEQKKDDSSKSSESSQGKVKESPPKRSIFTEKEMTASKSSQNLCDSYYSGEIYRDKNAPVPSKDAEEPVEVEEDSPLRPRKRKGLFRSIFTQKEKRAAAKADVFRGKRR